MTLAILALGALTGWLGSALAGATTRDATAVNVGAGIAGAMLGAWIVGGVPFPPAVDAGSELADAFVVLVGAIGAVAFAMLVRQRASA